MKIVFLGTNGWYTTPTGNTACILIDSSKHYVIFDAGNGIYKIDKYITQRKPISLFVSHFHIDHVSGFHTLDKFNFSQGMDIYVGEGRKKDFERLVNPPFTIGIKSNPNNITNMKMEVRLHELKEGKHQLSFPLEVIEQYHAFGDHGYRVTLEGKTIAYSGDCGISKGSLPLAKNADLLIHECSFKASHPPNSWGHVGPLEAAQLAKDAGVKRLILTHFDASQYMADRKEAEKAAQSIFPNTIAAEDELIISL